MAQAPPYACVPVERAYAACMDPIFSFDSNGAAWMLDIVLADGDLLRLDRVRAGLLTCESGRVLLTQGGPGKEREVDLAAGERCAVAATGVCVLVEAVGAVRLLLRAERGPWPWSALPRACLVGPRRGALRNGRVRSRCDTAAPRGDFTLVPLR